MRPMQASALSNRVSRARMLPDAGQGLNAGQDLNVGQDLNARRDPSVEPGQSAESARQAALQTGTTSVPARASGRAVRAAMLMTAPRAVSAATVRHRAPMRARSAANGKIARSAG
jgi:hypothetical protein